MSVTYCETWLAEVGTCFLSLLPPREAIESDNPFESQLSYCPKPASVVRLSDVLQDRPSHPRQTLRKALHRLAPTCRLLWSKTPWIGKTLEKAIFLAFASTCLCAVHDASASRNQALGSS